MAEEYFVRGRTAFRRGDYPEAREWLERALVSARSEGRGQLAFDALEVLGNACIADREPERILEIIGEQRQAGTATTADQSFRLEYVAGLALRELGRYREAVSAFDSAQTLAGALAPELARDARHMKATTELRLGASDVAQRELRALSQDALDPRERATVLTNLAWAYLLEREAGRRAGDDDARARLQEAQVLLESLPDTPASERGNVAVNLALEAVQAGEPAEAVRWLGASVRTSTAPELVSWQQYVRARIAIERRAFAEASQAAAVLREQGERDLALDWVWRSYLLDGDIAERRRDLDAARHAYGAAEDVLDRIVLGLPSDVGAMPYLDQRWQSAAAWFALESRAHRAEAGHRVVRRALRRFNLGGLRAARAEDPELRRLRRRYELARDRMMKHRGDEGDRGDEGARADALAAMSEYRRRAADEVLALASAPLRPLGLGEAQLTWFRVGSAWVRVEETATTTTVVPLGSMPAEGVARWAVASLGPQLARVTRARVVAPPAIADLSIHTELLDRFEVTYGLELPAVEVATEGDLVVAAVSSRGTTLRSVVREATSVCEAAGPACRLLVDGGSGAGLPATRTRLVAALARARYFHFAGHGEFSGENGWFSRLLLVGKDDLTAGDIALLGRVPEVVVLGACQAARVASGSMGGGAGLAKAFLVGGSRVVIAPTEDVQDEAAAWVAERLQAEEVWREPARALRAAQRAAQAAGVDRRTWTAFRALVR